jgi:hypothetical protein
MEVSLLNDLFATNSFFYGKGISTCDTLYTYISHKGTESLEGNERIPEEERELTGFPQSSQLVLFIENNSL